MYYNMQHDLNLPLPAESPLIRYAWAADGRANQQVVSMESARLVPLLDNVLRAWQQQFTAFHSFPDVGLCNTPGHVHLSTADSEGLVTSQFRCAVLHRPAVNRAWWGEAEATLVDFDRSNADFMANNRKRKDAVPFASVRARMAVGKDQYVCANSSRVVQLSDGEDLVCLGTQFLRSAIEAQRCDVHSDACLPSSLFASLCRLVAAGRTE
jgi:hypothetical protein